MSLAQRLSLAFMALMGAALVAAFIYGDAHAYDYVPAQAAAFESRMGIVHGGCNNIVCSGLRAGKPVNFSCAQSGCSFDAPEAP